jgi:hypothetical protein
MTMSEKKKLFAVETINGETVATKSDLLKASDNLAAQSRLLRKADAEHKALLQRMHDLGDAERARAADQKREAIAERMKSIVPLIEKGRALLTEAESAEREARSFIARFDGVDFDAVQRSLPSAHGVVAGSEWSTSTRLSLLCRTVDEAREILRGNQSELTAQIMAAESLGATEEVWRFNHPEAARTMQSPWSPDGRQTLARLERAIATGDRGTALRGKVGAIRKLLDLIGADILNPADAPTTTEETK